jgi:hypothetical protein
MMEEIAMVNYHREREEELIYPYPDLDVVL